MALSRGLDLLPFGRLKETMTTLIEKKLSTAS
jgi:hypothetical protein